LGQGLLAMMAQFRCLKCFFKWEDKPGPTDCPKCGYRYVKWLNFKKMRQQATLGSGFGKGV
jgi:rubrerythrin